MAKVPSTPADLDESNDAANPSFDWDAIELPDVEILPDKTRQTVDVPAALVALAQASWDQRKRMQMSFRGNAVQAGEFARLMRFAGDHTTPITSMSVVQDGIVVKYRAGERRGRKGNGKSAE
jgi:hypothetical protein